MKVRVKREEIYSAFNSLVDGRDTIEVEGEVVEVKGDAWKLNPFKDCPHNNIRCSEMVRYPWVCKLCGAVDDGQGFYEVGDE